MSQQNYTTKSRKFKHLTKEKRAQIEILLRRGVPKAEMRNKFYVKNCPPMRCADVQGWKENLMKLSAPKHSIITSTKGF